MTSMILTALASAILTGAVHDRTRDTGSTQDWTLVRSVSNGQGGTMDFVVVREGRRRDRAHYETIANAICGSRRTCMVHFWTDGNHVPTSAWMSGAGLTEMTAQYERSPTYKAPVLRLACWLYATKTEGEGDKCFYLPGARRPWSK